MLYCPQCGTEYREGYSSCADCHVLLVRERPQQSGGASLDGPEPGDPTRDPFTAFWQGDDSRIHLELCSLLDEAGILHITIRKQDHLFRITTQPNLLLAVPFSQLEKAESVIQEAFGETPELTDSEEQAEGQPPEQLNDWTHLVRNTLRKGVLPTILEKLREPRSLHEKRDESMEARNNESRDEAGAARNMDPDDWFPSDATVEIWSGKDELQAEMISASLSENDIHSRTDEFKDLRLVFVQAQDEPRAREIIREITESTPSE